MSKLYTLLKPKLVRIVAKKKKSDFLSILLSVAGRLGTKVTKSNCFVFQYIAM